MLHEIDALLQTRLYIYFIHVYSGTSLQWTPLGQKYFAVEFFLHMGVRGEGGRVGG